MFLCFCLQDFKEQIIHHVATIALIAFSWLVNYIRAGTLIMLVHDASDYLMEVWKRRNIRLRSRAQMLTSHIWNPVRHSLCLFSVSYFRSVSKSKHDQRLSWWCLRRSETWTRKTSPPSSGQVVKKLFFFFSLISVSQNVQLCGLEENVQLHLHRVCGSLHCHAPCDPPLLVCFKYNFFFFYILNDR